MKLSFRQGAAVIGALLALTSSTVFAQTAYIQLGDGNQTLETNSGTKQNQWSVTLSELLDIPVTFSISTSDGTANAGSDYPARSFTVTIPARTSGVYFYIESFGDVTAEPDEYFNFKLSNLKGARLLAPGVYFPADNTYVYRENILNDDSPPTLSVSDSSVREGDGGNTLATFAVNLSKVDDKPVTYDVVVSNGSAVAGSDYGPVHVTAVPAGSLSGSFSVEVVGDTEVELSEAFNAKVVNVSGADVADPNAIGIIRNNDSGSWRADFDGDGKDDVLWHNSDTGQNVIWKSANALTAQAVAAVAPAWIIAGVGDFNADGRSDVLWRNLQTGANTIWLSANSSTFQIVGSLTDLQWKVVGVGDFGGDGRADILWRNLASGSNMIWASGNAATSQPLFGITNMDWLVVGVGDFGGDFRSDILWRNRVTGANVIWSSGNSATQQSVATLAGSSWKVANVADFDKDGKDDILWRHSGTGANMYWPGGKASTSLPLTAMSDLAWRVAGIGDYDGDGSSEILWRNSASGANLMWPSGQSNGSFAIRSVIDLAWIPES